MNGNRTIRRRGKGNQSDAKCSYSYKSLGEDGRARGNKFRVFLSYSSEDESFVERLAGDLANSYGISVWWYHGKIRVGNSIIKEINEHIRNADYIVLILSPHSVTSPWVERELNAAIIQELQVGLSTILPALIADCNIPPLIADRRYADFRVSYHRGLAELVQAIEIGQSVDSDS